VDRHQGREESARLWEQHMSLHIFVVVVIRQLNAFILHLASEPMPSLHSLNKTALFIYDLYIIEFTLYTGYNSVILSRKGCA
jgi:hypothetical protein